MMTRTQAKRFVVIAISCIAMTLSACGPKRVDLAAYATQPDVRQILIKSVAYDIKGRPQFSRLLSERPAKAGETFTVLFQQKDKTLFSVDLAVEEEHPDPKKPFQALYTWTDKGFSWGVGAAGSMVTGSFQSAGGPVPAGTAVVVVAGSVVPIALGTATGFVVGLAEGVKEAVVESGKLIVAGREVVVTNTRYDYDADGRLLRMRMRRGDTESELVRTEFFYEGTERTPYRTVITSIPEDSIRVIQ